MRLAQSRIVTANAETGMTAITTALILIPQQNFDVDSAYLDRVFGDPRNRSHEFEGLFM